MMSPNAAAVVRPGSYSLTQIVLHWAIAALVVWQLFIGDHPPRAAPAGSITAVADLWTRTVESSHVWIGLAILALVVVRIVLRLARGAPPPEETNRLQALAARVTHFAFYVLLVFMPVTGILAWYFALPVGDLHEAGEPLFVALIALHVAAPLWHQFVRRDGLMARMVAPAR